jgi:hypothetical protein
MDILSSVGTIAWNFGLERGYWLAHILLLLVASVAAIFAFVHVRTFRLFELLRFLEDHRIREARRRVFRKVKKDDQSKWWETDPELEEAAGTVCASYDIVAHLATGRIRKLFVREWANSICWSHERLETYLKERRINVPNAYHGYSELYRDAKPFDPRAKT